MNRTILVVLATLCLGLSVSTFAQNFSFSVNAGPYDGQLVGPNAQNPLDPEPWDFKGFRSGMSKGATIGWRGVKIHWNFFPMDIISRIGVNISIRQYGRTERVVVQSRLEIYPLGKRWKAQWFNPGVGFEPYGSNLHLTMVAGIFQFYPTKSFFVEGRLFEAGFRIGNRDSSHDRITNETVLLGLGCGFTF